MILCILVIILMDSKLGDKILDRMVAGIPSVQSVRNFFMNAVFIL
jgi:hypothetical protein